VHKSFTATIDSSPNDVFEIVADLSTYPNWLGLVSEVAATEDESAWMVTLRARIGPLARSKRLRMVRSVHRVDEATGGGEVRFERLETDGRDHSEWVLASVVEPAADGAAGSTVTMELTYGGSLWSGLLDGPLEAAAEEATEQLRRYAAA
jgi:hypothetical protein